MRKLTIILLLILIIPFYLISQSLVNNGAAITIKNGSAINIEGKLIHRNNSHVLNNGIINLNGDYENFSIDPVVFLPGTNGLLKFKGSDTHTIDGTGPLVVPSLSIETDVVFNNLVIIENHLQFNNGNIFLTYPSLDIETGATLSGYGPNAYIKTYGNEVIYFPVGTNETTVPIGTTTSYTPISILSNDGTGEVYISLFADVLENGNSGSTISEIEQTIKHTWELSFWGFPSIPDLDITFQWPGNVEGTDFNPSTAALSYFNQSAWDFFPIQGSTGGNPYQLEQQGISQSGQYTIWSKQPELITLDLKVYLEGPFNGSDMNTDLNGIVEFPYSQPYNTQPWNYTGNETISVLPNNQVVDWVLIEWRDAPDAASAIEATTFAQKAAFLLKDGSIVDLDGLSHPEMNTLLSDKLFVVIKHRNHLALMSATPLNKNGGLYSYDFTTSANQAYSNNQRNLGNGIWGMFGGDLNADDIIDNLDLELWKVSAGEKGYRMEDANMNKEIDNQDKNTLWYHNNGKIVILPQ